MELFDKYGRCVSDDVNNTANEIAKLAADCLDRIVKAGANGLEIRACGTIMSLAAGVEPSMAVMKYGLDLRKKETEDSLKEFAQSMDSHVKGSGDESPGNK